MTHHLLLREQAPLSAEQWNNIDRLVIETARRQLVGRRLLPIYGPLGAGVMAVQSKHVSLPENATISLQGEEPALVKADTGHFISIPLLYRDFIIPWREIEQADQFGMPLDVSPAAAAAQAVAQREDKLIFFGHQDLGQTGLLNAAGHTIMPRGNWGKEGQAFADVISAITKLVAMGFYGPYALVTSTGLFAATNRLFDNTGVLEIEEIRNVVSGGVFLSAVLPEPTALVLSLGAENFDLAVAQDIVTAFLQVDNLNYYFRVIEAVAPRVKRPEAVVVLGGA